MEFKWIRCNLKRLFMSMDCRVLLLASQQARKKPCGFNIIASFTSSLHETDPRFHPKKSPQKHNLNEVDNGCHRSSNWCCWCHWTDDSQFKWPGEGCCVSSATDGSSTICGAWSEDDGGRKAWGGEYEMLINTKFNVYKITSCWRLLTELAGAMTVPGRLWRHIGHTIWHDHSHVFHRQRLQRLTATVPSLELLPPQSADKTVSSAKPNLKELNFIEIWGFPKMVVLLNMIILGCFGGTTI